jgi:Xaa-Pro aminopeptidase
VSKWLAEKFEGFEDVVIALDGLSMSAGSVEEIVQAFGGKCTIENVPDLLSPLWLDRPEVPQTPIITLGPEQVGWSRGQKLSWLRRWIGERNCDAIFLTALDEIAWTLNVRGQDVAYNPVVMSYLLVTQDSAIWFVRKDSSCADDSETEDSFRELVSDGVSIQEYSDVAEALSGVVDGDYIKTLFVDLSTLNYNLWHVLESCPGEVEIVRGDSPVALRKAVKNAVEIARMREAHRGGRSRSRALPPLARDHRFLRRGCQ